MGKMLIVNLFSCLHFIVRLVEGPNLREGRLEVLRLGMWRDVCYDYSSSTKAVDDRAARVICSMLGYGYAYYTFDCLEWLS